MKTQNRSYDNDDDLKSMAEHKQLIEIEARQGQLLESKGTNVKGA